MYSSDRDYMELVNGPMPDLNCRVCGLDPCECAESGLLEDTSGTVAIDIDGPIHPVCILCGLGLCDCEDRCSEVNSTLLPDCFTGWFPGPEDK